MGPQGETSNVENQPKRRRYFEPLPMTLTKSLEILHNAGLVTSLHPQQPLNLIPLTWKMHENCLYHQVTSHNTKKCLAFRYRIQDLINDKTIPLLRGPNVTKNLLPNHALGINALITEKEGFDPYASSQTYPLAHRAESRSASWKEKKSWMRL